MSSICVLKKLLQVCCLIMATAFLFAQPAHAFDIPKDCSDLEMLQHKWETQYFYDLKFNGYLNFIPELKCGSRTYKFAKAIWVLENIKVSPEFGDIYEQLKTYVKRFIIIPELDNKSPKTCAGTDALAPGRIILLLCAFGQEEQKNSQAWDQDVYLKNLFQLVGTIVHELVHVKYPKESVHYDCHGHSLACDTNFETYYDTKSAYSYEILYIQDILSNNPFSTEDQRQISSYIRRVQRSSFLNPVSK